MTRWSVQASVTVDLNMDLEAESRDEAERLLEAHISMTANMVDLPQDRFEVWDDTISEIDDVVIHIAPATKE